MVGDVSADRIMGTVRDLEEFGSRAFMLPASADAAEYIRGRFAELNLSVEMQHFMVGDFQVANVVASHNGTDPDAPQYLFGAHYDSENKYALTYADVVSMPAPGADDDASGIASVIELATLLSTMEFESTLRFVAFGAEEYGYDYSGGLKGSAYFASIEEERDAEYGATAILDMIGWKSGEENMATGLIRQETDPFADAVKDSVRTHGINLTFEVKVAPAATFSDHYSFWRMGYPSMLVTEEIADSGLSLLYPYYHTPSDTSDKLSEDQLVSVTQALLGAVLLLLEPDDFPATLIIIIFVVASAAVAVTLYFVIPRRKD